MSTRFREARLDRLLNTLISTFSLDLGGLVVFTEAANGWYRYTPILAALSGATRVYALTRDSSYDTAANVRSDTQQAAEEWGVADRVTVLDRRDPRAVGEADIVTNTGFVRPIDRELITWMKPTAVVPLMWEPWEIRSGEIDFDACREKGIVVMGTDEGAEPQALYGYAGFLALKLLFELGLEGCKSRVILLGGGEGLGRSIVQHLRALGLELAWFTDTEIDAYPYALLPEWFDMHGHAFDAVLVAEHRISRTLLGGSGFLSWQRIREANAAMRIGVISGVVDGDGLAKSGLVYYPPVLKPYRYMSYQPDALGPRPVLELYAAGLRVGQVLARARLEGKLPSQAVAWAAEQVGALPIRD
jgi:hypothetical protein